MTLDEMKDFRVSRNTGMGQVRQSLQHYFALMQVAQSKFADNEGVRQNPPRVEQCGERLVARPQMVDPDRRIGQDHAALDRRRGGGVRPGWLPPRRAKRRALSRSMSALSASRTRLDFSFKPVSAAALATSSSSKARVVRICRPPPSEARNYHQMMPHSMPPEGHAGAHRQRPDPLTGICFCAACGGAMTLRTGKGGRYRYYTCSIKTHQGEAGCKGRSIPLEKLDNLVAEHIAERLLRPERLEEIPASILDGRQERAERRREHITELNKRPAEADLRLKPLYDAIEAGIADLDDPALKERIASLKAIRGQAQAGAARAAATLESSGQQAITPQMVQKFARTARERIEVDGGVSICARSRSASRWLTARPLSSARKAACLKR